MIDSRQQQETLARIRALKAEREEHDEASASRGLGDTVAKVTSMFGIKPCGGCKKRQKKLNEMFPYKNKGHK